MNKTEEILKLIKKKRTEQKVSQKQLADYLGITQPQYARIESGQSEMKVEALFRILDYLGIDLFGTEPPKAQTETTMVAVNSESFEKVLMLLAQNQVELKAMQQVNQDEIGELKKNYEQTQADMRETKTLLQKILAKLK